MTEKYLHQTVDVVGPFGLMSCAFLVYIVRKLVISEAQLVILKNFLISQVHSNLCIYQKLTIKSHMALTRSWISILFKVTESQIILVSSYFYIFLSPL